MPVNPIVILLGIAGGAYWLGRQSNADKTKSKSGGRNRIPLEDVLSQISTQLRSVDKKARESGKAVMQFDECNIEFDVSATKSVQGGTTVWVELGARAENTHRSTVRLHMKNIPQGSELPAGAIVAQSLIEQVPDGPPVVRQDAESAESES